MSVATTRETTRGHVNSKGGVMGRLKSFLSRTRAERQLLALDDRLLADIGVNRGDISRSVWGA
jgi:uncharacterized protein YjiS (DUF1127 family)